MVRTITLRTLLAIGLWYVLVEGRTDLWGSGVVAVSASVWASISLLPPSSIRINPIGFLALLRLFIWNSLRGAFQVSLLAFRGRRSLRPDLLLLTLNLPPGGPRILLVNAMTLMPGTLGVHLDGERLRVHVLDERFPVEREVQRLEDHIARLFGAAR